MILMIAEVVTVVEKEMEVMTKKLVEEVVVEKVVLVVEIKALLELVEIVMEIMGRW